MKKYLLVVMVALLGINCNGQKKESKDVATNATTEKAVQEPKGSWKVDKEFDERGNLIRYDSIYSWSSDGSVENLSTLEKDSLLQSFKSRFFTNFSSFENQGFGDVFSEDSLFSHRFFNEDFFDSKFGKDFMNIDDLTQQMLERQKKFLKKYQSEYKVNPEEKN